MSALQGKRIGVIGAGAIGGAVIDRILSIGLGPEGIIACETREERRKELAARYRVRTTAEAREAATADLIVLAVPPAAAPKVLDALREVATRQQVIVSFAGGVPLDYLESRLPSGVPVVRVNPNSPSIAGSGFNPVTYGRFATGAARQLADAFLAALGTSPEIPDAQMNLYTALTAVGPTYFLPVFDALISAGQAGGLSREAAVDAAVSTARGVAELVARRPEAPEQLKLLTGLRPLKDQDVRQLVADAIQAAITRMEDVQRGIVQGG